MTKLICILLLVVLAIIIARCNGSSKLGRNLLVSIALGVAVSFGIQMYNSTKVVTTKPIAKIESVSTVNQLPTQFLCTPVAIQAVLNYSGTVSQVLLNSAYATVKERLRPVNNPRFDNDVGLKFWDSS